MERLQQELQAVGCACHRIVNGVPVVESGNPTVSALVQAIHIADEATYIATDLEEHAAALESLVTQNQWEAYLAVQTDLILSLRRAAYVALDDEASWIERFAEASNFGQLLTTTKGLVADVEAAFPFPGEY
jgi:hypothetical protein